MSEGTLAKDAFARYVSQNFLYLGGYARALALVAARSSDPETVAFLSRRAAHTVESEQAFASGLMAGLGLDPDLLGTAGRQPAPSSANLVSL